MKLRFCLYVISLLFFLSGCAQFNLNNPTPSDAGGQHAGQASDMSDAEGTEKNEAALGGASSGDTIAGSSAQDCEGDENCDDADQVSPKKTQAILDEALDLCKVSQDFWQNGELENALDALDQAYALIISVDTHDNPKLIQQKEDLRFMISKRILEIYASRNIVVNGNHNAIPVVINRHVQAEIDLFTKRGESKFFINSYRRSGRYRPQITAALQAAGLPVELSWLPLIESGFKVNALSRSRALGLWQFIPSTGYKFGLNRDKFIDERMDPVKATHAAIEYLKQLHGMFGDWSTVLAAYNCGEGRVLKVIRSQNINYLDNFWDLYARLPRETARYVPRFLATLHILNNPEKYGLDLVTPDSPLEYETVTISKQVHLKNVAQAVAVSEKRLKELNPELRYSIIPGDNYPLRVPPGNSDILLAKIDNIPVSHPPQRAFVYHRVRSGESLSVISRKYRASVGSIMRANNLRRSNYIVAGKLLKIPQRGYVHKTPKTPKPKTDQAAVHIVRKGDSLWIIAKKYGTTVKKIQDLNHLSTTDLKKGQVLTVVAGKSKPPVIADLSTYKVRSGDSPFVIARRHNMSLDRLLYINKLYPSSKIYPGQKLYIE